MKNLYETARHWSPQAEHNLRLTATLLGNGCSTVACFHYEQTTNLAFQSFLHLQDCRRVNIYEAAPLAIECVDLASALGECVDYRSLLDHCYLAARYPDALPKPAVPFESFADQKPGTDWTTQLG